MAMLLVYMSPVVFFFSYLPKKEKQHANTNHQSCNDVDNLPSARSPLPMKLIVAFI